jgi:uncharacterized repeat protein (TIGR01451 family)
MKMNKLHYLRAFVCHSLFAFIAIVSTTFVSDAQVVRPYGLIYSNSLKGTHTMFGNSILAIKNDKNVDDVDKMNDFGAYAKGVTSQYLNDESNMGFIDIDGGAPAPTALVSSGDAWSYSNTASEPAGWPVVAGSLPGGTGASPLGYGPTGPVGTSVADMRTYYFEKKVVINPALYGSFTFNVTADDGAVVYVNGTEVGRVNMPGGAVSFTTDASSNIEPEKLFSFNVGTGAPFINGVNSITVEMHTAANNENGTDDLFFDLQLLGNGTNATQNSSSADLVMPAGSTVKFARLYWGGRINGGDGGADNINLRSAKIKFGAGAYSSVVAAPGQVDKVSIVGSDSAYQAFVDITAFVAAGGVGTYTVADIKAATGAVGAGGNFAGWGILVVYENAAFTFSSIRLYDGYLQVYDGGQGTTQSIELSGLNAPANPLNSADARMTVMAWEGDAGLAASDDNPAGDYVKVNNTVVANAANPAVNMWNGTISKNGIHVTNKNPNYKNQFGIDIDEVEVGVGYGIAANATKVNVEFGTEADRYFPSVFGFTMVSKDPSVTLDKAVSDELAPYGVLQTNETLTYTISGSNVGVGPAYNCTVVDSIPSNVTFIPGSLEIVSSPGIVAGLKTDGANDDEAFKGTVNTKDYVKFFIGTGATNLSGGVLQPNESYSLRFKVLTPANANKLSTVSNTARITAQAFSGEEFSDDGTAIINPPGGTLAVKLSAFNVSKENDNAVLRWVTQSEVKNDAFVIERSLDGISFSKIGTVKGNGTTSNISNYQFADPLSGLSAKMVYYRLRIVDIDGKSGFSKIIALRLDGSVVVNNLSVYPNPFTSDIKLRINGTKEENLTVRISSMSGQVVVKRSVSIQPGENIVVLKDLGTLAKGTHLLEIITADGSIAQKIMKN